MLSVLTDKPRTADVKATSDCMLLSLGKADLEIVLHTFPAARMRIESSSEQSGLFSPSAYHWLFFAPPAPGLKVVPWRTKSVLSPLERSRGATEGGGGRG